MKTSQAAAVVIWLIALILAFFGSPVQNREVAQIPAMVIFPVVFFTAAAFWMKGYPFDVVPLRLWIDKKRGDGRYAEFIRQLKPMLLFGMSGLAAATAGFLRALQVNSPLEALSAQGFALSAAAGFLLARAILVRRGLSMESRAISAPWAERQFLPESIRGFRATRVTAMITGAWTILGIGTAQALLATQDRNSITGQSIWFGASIIFFFIPVFIFVFGIQNPKMREMATFSRAALKQQGMILVRVLYWLLGAVLCALSVGILSRLAIWIVS
jgi:hypothetical protein